MSVLPASSLLSAVAFAKYEWMSCVSSPLGLRCHIENGVAKANEKLCELSRRLKGLCGDNVSAVSWVECNIRIAGISSWL